MWHGQLFGPQGEANYSLHGCIPSHYKSFFAKAAPPLREEGCRVDEQLKVLAGEHVTDCQFCMGGERLMHALHMDKIRYQMWQKRAQFCHVMCDPCTYCICTTVIQHDLLRSWVIGVKISGYHSPWIHQRMACGSNGLAKHVQKPIIGLKVYICSFPSPLPPPLYWCFRSGRGGWSIGDAAVIHLHMFHYLVVKSLIFISYPSLAFKKRGTDDSTYLNQMMWQEILRFRENIKIFPYAK